jgi:membrane-bound metal-dependent hydrolase YbcI (DUF457 family)
MMPPIALLATVLLDVLPPSPSARPSVDPTASSYGFAATILGGFFALGLLVLVIVLFNRRPRSVRK